MLVLYVLLVLAAWLLSGFISIVISTYIKAIIHDECFKDEFSNELKNKDNIIFYIGGPMSLMIAVILSVYALVAHRRK